MRQMTLIWMMVVDSVTSAMSVLGVSILVGPPMLKMGSGKEKSFVLCCSEFIGEVRHVDERWYLLVHLSGFYEHEKQSAADKSKAGQRTVTQPGNMSTSESLLNAEPNDILQ